MKVLTRLPHLNSECGRFLIAQSRPLLFSEKPRRQPRSRCGSQFGRCNGIQVTCVNIHLNWDRLWHSAHLLTRCLLFHIADDGGWDAWHALVFVQSNNVWSITLCSALDAFFSILRPWVFLEGRIQQKKQVKWLNLLAIQNMLNISVIHRVLLHLPFSIATMQVWKVFFSLFSHLIVTSKHSHVKRFFFWLKTVCNWDISMPIAKYGMMA